MTTYQPGVGIVNSDPLEAGDIGNVLPATGRASTAGSKIPAGTYGRMNSGLVGYTDSPYTDDGKMAEDEVETLLQNGRRVGLTQLYRNPQGGPIGVRTVERWFDLPGPNGQHQPLNCVTVNAIGLRICQMAGSHIDVGFGNLVTGEEVRLRCILAACLAVEGGLQRLIDWNRGEKDGSPYENRETFGMVADCVEYLEAVYDGYVVAEDNSPLKGWVQMTIEPSEAGEGWDAVVLYYQRGYGQGSDPVEEGCTDDME